MNLAEPELSIIIPSFNEEARLPATLEKIAVYIANSGRSTEVLVVDDGSTDGTAAVANLHAQKIPGLRVISNGENHGKGYSVRHGMQVAKGRLVLFTDADLSAPIEEADKLLQALETHDVARPKLRGDRKVHRDHVRDLWITANGLAITEQKNRLSVW